MTSPPTLPPIDSLPPRLRAGDALSFTLATSLAPGQLVFFVLNGVILRVPTQLTLGGTGVGTTVGGVTTYSGTAVDATGAAAIAAASTVTAAWLPGRYDWFLFSLDPATGNRDQIASGQIRVEANVAAAAVDNRSYNQRCLDQIRCTLEDATRDDVQMYKIGTRELARIPRKDLLQMEAVFEGRVKAERRRKGQRVPSDTIGIRFGGGR